MQDEDGLSWRYGEQAIIVQADVNGADSIKRLAKQDKDADIVVYDSDALVQGFTAQ